MVKEKDVVNLLLFVAIALLILVTINYAIFILSRMQKVPQSNPRPAPVKFQEPSLKPDDSEYRKIIEKSRSDYKDFMEKKIPLP